MDQNKINISEYIAENFGANASYVEGLLSRYQSDPNSVDDSWHTFFGEMLNGKEEVSGSKFQVSNAEKSDSSNGATAKQTEAKQTETAKVETAKPKTETTVKIGEGVEVKPLTGASKAIVENMEQSLTVPTATSVRNIPVKVLVENRTIINENLARQAGGKVSFTHVIAWAIVKAVRIYPQMNNGFGFVEGKPSRLQNTSVNLGIAIDIEKKDGSRNLLVPNIKTAKK